MNTAAARPVTTKCPFSNSNRTAMPNRATASFDVTGWDETPYDEQRKGPLLSRAVVRKTFKGDLDATSVAELLMCRADAEDLSAGAGYVASERVEGTLDGRKGSFVIQHGGLSSGDEEQAFGNIVPGSGTGELRGLKGTSQIDRTPNGGHRLVLHYTLG